MTRTKALPAGTRARLRSWVRTSAMTSSRSGTLFGHARIFRPSANEHKVRSGWPLESHKVLRWGYTRRLTIYMRGGALYWVCTRRWFLFFVWFTLNRILTGRWFYFFVRCTKQFEELTTILFRGFTNWFTSRFRVARYNWFWTMRSLARSWETICRGAWRVLIALKIAVKLFQTFIHPSKRDCQFFRRFLRLFRTFSRISTRCRGRRFLLLFQLPACGLLCFIKWILNIRILANDVT